MDDILINFLTLTHIAIWGRHSLQLKSLEWASSGMNISKDTAKCGLRYVKIDKIFNSPFLVYLMRCSLTTRLVRGIDTKPFGQRDKILSTFQIHVHVNISIISIHPSIHTYILYICIYIAQLTDPSVSVVSQSVSRSQSGIEEILLIYGRTAWRHRRKTPQCRYTMIAVTSPRCRLADVRG